MTDEAYGEIKEAIAFWSGLAGVCLILAILLFVFFAP